MAGIAYQYFERRECSDRSRVLKFAVEFGSLPDETSPLLPTEIPERFITLLAQLARLQELTVLIPKHQVPLFADQLIINGLSLPNVHTLMVGPSCEFAVSLCPGLKTLAQITLLPRENNSDNRQTRTQASQTWSRHMQVSAILNHLNWQNIINSE